MKNTLKILAIAAIYTCTTANAQVNTIDSVATSKVQHFNFDEMESATIGDGIQRKWFPRTERSNDHFQFGKRCTYSVAQTSK